MEPLSLRITILGPSTCAYNLNQWLGHVVLDLGNE